MQKLKQFSINKVLSPEKKSVRLQFYVFFIAFSIKAIYSAYWLITTFYQGITIGNYITAVVYTILWIPWNIVPLSVVFYIHFKSFIRSNARLSSESSDSGGPVEITIDPNDLVIGPYETDYM